MKLRNLVLILSVAGAVISGCSTTPGKTVILDRQGTIADNLMEQQNEIKALPLKDGAWIQAKINETAEGVLTIPSGRYLLPDTLLIKGHKGNKLTIQGTENTTLHIKDIFKDVLRIEDSSEIIISSLKLSHLVPSKEYECHGSVIVVAASDNITVSGCTLNGCGAIGFSARKSHHLKLKKCSVFKNTFNAVYLSDCEWIQVIDNIIFNNGNTYQVHDCNFVEIWGNETWNNGGYWEER